AGRTSRGRRWSGPSPGWSRPWRRWRRRKIEMRILIAEDEAVSRRLLQSYLEKWGHEVVAAADGAEAWRLFQAGGGPRVPRDPGVPEGDGLELIRRIRATEGRGYVYIILLTAKSQKEDLVVGMEAGANDFVAKPFDREELRARLRAG